MNNRCLYVACIQSTYSKVFRICVFVCVCISIHLYSLRMCNTAIKPSNVSVLHKNNHSFLEQCVCALTWIWYCESFISFLFSCYCFFPFLCLCFTEKCWHWKTFCSSFFIRLEIQIPWHILCNRIKTKQIYSNKNIFFIYFCLLCIQ